MSTSSASFADRLFHAYDIRIDASLLSKERATQLFDAVAVYAKEQLHVEAIVVCRDARLSGNTLQSQAIDHFLNLGFTVYSELNPITTCQFYYACTCLGRVMGLMLGASHNPASYTGQKLVGPYCTPIAEQIGPAGGLSAIRTYFEEGRKLESGSQRGQLICLSEQERYIQDCLSRSGVEPSSFAGMKVVVDFLNGSSAPEILRALQIAGVEVVARNMVPDGSFPNGPPNPILAQSTSSTFSYLAEHPDYDFCLLFDGDGDRVDVVARGLKAVEPSLVMAFLAPILKGMAKSEGRVSIGFDPKANPLLVNSIIRYGIEPTLIPNGHSKIKGLLVEQASRGLLAGVEESAHYYLSLSYEGREVAIESTLLITLLFLKTWREETDRFSDLLALQTGVARKREWGYTYPSASLRLHALSEVEQAFLAQGYEALKTQTDGKPLGSTLLRLGMAGESKLWACISQRSSESEEGIARWSVVASDSAILAECVNVIEGIASRDAVGSYHG